MISDKEIYNKFSERVKKARESMKISYEELSEKTGLEVSYLEAIENNVDLVRGISMPTLFKLSLALYVSTDYLIFGRSL